MESLTAQTIRRLCDRLETFRLKGPIPALMAEYRVGAPSDETQPLEEFGGALSANALRQLSDGRRLSRSLWLAADVAVVRDYRNLCRDAARVALPLLQMAGYHVGLGTSDLTTRWLWSLFELAALRLPGTDLRLDGDTVWRVCAGGAAIGEGILDNPGIFAALAETAGPTRYWKLVDAVEASLAVMDLAQLQQEPAACAAEANGDRGKGRLKRKMRPEEHLILLYLRDPKVATLESRSLPDVAKAAFGESFTDRAYRDTVVYGEWRTALEETVCHHGKGWLEGDVLEAGLEIYGAKPGRSDKRSTWDAKHEAAVKAFMRDSAAATSRAKVRLEDGGK